MPSLVYTLARVSHVVSSLSRARCSTDTMRSKSKSVESSSTPHSSLSSSTVEIGADPYFATILQLCTFFDMRLPSLFVSVGAHWSGDLLNARRTIHVNERFTITSSTFNRSYHQHLTAKYYDYLAVTLRYTNHPRKPRNTTVPPPSSTKSSSISRKSSLININISAMPTTIET